MDFKVSYEVSILAAIAELGEALNKATAKSHDEIYIDGPVPVKLAGMDYGQFVFEDDFWAWEPPPDTGKTTLPKDVVGLIRAIATDMWFYETRKECAETLCATYGITL